MEEPCRLDGFLRNVFEIADDILRLPATIGRLHTQPPGGTDYYMLVTYSMHDCPAFFPLGEIGSDSRRIESTRRGASLLEAHATCHKHQRWATLEI